MTRPPQLCERLLERAVPPLHREAILGDLAEEYVNRSASNWWYCKEAFMVLLHTRVNRMFIAVGLNIAAFAIFWLLGFAVNRLFDPPVSRILLPVLTAASVLIALRLRAKPMAFFLAAMVAFLLAELIAHSFWGIRVVQGAPTHLTVMGAGLFGVIFGAVLVRHTAGHKATTVETTA